MNLTTNDNARRWYSMAPVAAAATEPSSAEVYIYDYIGYYEITARDFVRDLKALGDVAELSVHINSGGGEVFEGLAIYNALKANPAHVTVYVDGIAASLASYVAMAGDTVEVAENGYFMIHEPWNISIGTADDMRKDADRLDKLRNTLAAGYANKTGQSADDVVAVMAAETWFDASEALEWGLVDRVGAKLEAAASIADRNMNHVPAGAQAWITTETEPKGKKMNANCIIENGIVRAATAEEMADEKVEKVDVSAELRKSIEDSIYDSGYAAGRDESTAGLKAELTADHGEKQDVLQAEVSALKGVVEESERLAKAKASEIDHLNASLEKAQKRLETVGAGLALDANSSTDIAPESFWAAVETIKASEECDDARAMLLAQRKFPELHASMCKGN